MEHVKLAVRKPVRRIASWINHLSGGKVMPAQITILGLLMHLPIAWLIVDQQFVWAGILLIVFGLFDTLDGELARLQRRTSLFGAFLDSTTDRTKEVLLYAAIAYIYALAWQPGLVLLAVAALGISFLISYINSAGDVATQQVKQAQTPANRTYRSGLAGFEVRIALLIVGLLFNILPTILMIICLLGLHTIWLRFIKVKRTLSDA